jgi:outer membrane immunogenic protein
MFRNLLSALGVSSLLLAAPLSAAGAADMPFKAPPPPMPASTWTGCYLAGGIGYGMSNLDQYEETYPGLGAVSGGYTDGGRGWLGRVGAGCDYQITSSFVVGVFGDYDFMHVHAGFSPGDLALSGDENERGAWSVGGRIGYLVTPGLMTYFDAGYTQTRFDQINLSGLVAPFAAVGYAPASTYHGWFLGGGTEYALNFNWLPIHGLFWRNEYRFSSYDAEDLPIYTTAGALSPVGENIHPYVQTITSSLVWRFNFGR